MRHFLRIAIAFLMVIGSSQLATAEVKEVRITHQPGMIYMPLILMEQNRLVEKHAAARGVEDLKVSWLTFSGGGASNDALLSGNVDFVTTGTTSLLLLWDRTKGEVKGLAGAGGAPMLLVTRNPAVKTLADFSEKDRIAVPTVKISTQAVLLQIAAERQLGQPGRNKLDSITVQLGHPDAMRAVLSPNHEVNSHFSLPPYQNIELKDPNVHTVLNSYDLVGGPLTNALVYGTRKFVEANPKITESIVAALDEATGLIQADPEKAARTYLEATKEKISADELVAMMKQPGVVFSTTPYGSMLQAEHYIKTGMIKMRPRDWREFYFLNIHDRQGN